MTRKRYDSLAAYLKDTGQTQEQLADALGISYPQMSRIVRGRQMPKPELALRIADLTGVSVESLARAAAKGAAA